MLFHKSKPGSRIGRTHPLTPGYAGMEPRMRELIERYRSALHVPVRSKDAFLAHVGAQLDLAPASMGCVSPAYVRMLLDNAAHHLETFHIPYDPVALAFDAYEVVRNAKSEAFFADVSDAGAITAPRLFLFVEQTHPIAAATSARLMLELQALWGVSEEDIETGSLHLQAVVSALHLCDGTYGGRLLQA